LLELRPDPTGRTTLIHALPAWRGDLVGVAALLRGSGNPALRSGLCAALGLVEPGQLAAPERQALANALLHWYGQASDGGTHSAAGWALSQWHMALPALAVSAGSQQGREWFVNRHHMTMLKIRPDTFTMGDADQPGAEPHEVTLTRPFFICDRETWVDLFLQFTQDLDYPAAEKPRDWKGPHQKVSPTGDCPVNMVNWYDAVLFCNWLSQREGRQPCYVLMPPSAKDGDEGGDVWAHNAAADGYRLPTEEEWEFACRAGTSTAYYFGNDPELLPGYSITWTNSRMRAWPGASKLPNCWGLFDMVGNVEEWCWDRAATSKPKGKGVAEGPKGGNRVTRGGSFLTPQARFVTSGFPNTSPPGARTATRGFRVVCGA
jgi:formylglycine-generating enzyme required for sulfatase activity